MVANTGSTYTFAEKVKVVEANFEDAESLKTALTDQDAVVSTVGDKGVIAQQLLIDASIAAGVKRFLPSNFSSNMSNHKTRKLPIFKSKVAVEDYLIEKSKTSDLTYTFVYNWGLTDFAIQRKVIMDFSKYQPTIFNRGDSQFSCTRHANCWKDRSRCPDLCRRNSESSCLLLQKYVFTQNQILALAKKIAPNNPWAPLDVDLNVVVAGALERLAQGQHDLPTVIPILLKSIVDEEYGFKFVKNDNELLGIKEKGEEYLTELLTPSLN
ncbi:hypothetical protein UA08_07148 [Talaromyces atroroseus]|uniref:NmrA-like domain-containing protein n=1 Tax=Talaromyces atroroseus TaxID=1441469 RepID=A0A225AS30_TALAT|nr:hypothetical protein UA08_07148 [Talaromyces atroroseus]OKL57776.1 hypothetical protein UA08_07148 [Talaromyces atroroseus]